jgi:hypothetical protein
VAQEPASMFIISAIAELQKNVWVDVTKRLEVGREFRCMVRNSQPLSESINLPWTNVHWEHDV